MDKGEKECPGPTRGVAKAHNNLKLFDKLKWVRVVATGVRGVAEIDSKVFIVFNESSNIEMYDALTFNQLAAIELQELRKPRDIVACRVDNQLFISDCLLYTSPSPRD